jgi:hypothetical protein
VGDGHTGEPQANHERLTVAQAAIRLGITEGAVRSRIKRGTLPTAKEGGNVFVLLGGGTSQANQTTNTDVPGDQSELIEALRDQVEDLRQERDEWREQARITDRLLSAAMERIPAIEAPSEAEASESHETADEASHKAPEEPRPAAEGAQAGTERPQERSGWLAPVDKLPWWHYVLGLVLVGLAMFGSYFVPATVSATTIVGLVVLVWLPPGLFGSWVGLRSRNPRFSSQAIPFGLLVGLAGLLGRLGWLVAFGTEEFNRSAVGGGPHPEYWSGFVFGGFLPACLSYVSGFLLGNAWQRRRAGRLPDAIPASQAPTMNWSPKHQAILGFAGTIIAALIGLLAR